MQRRKWTIEMDEMLKAHYPHKSTDSVATQMGMSFYTIQARAKRLKLTKSDKYLQTLEQQRRFRLRESAYKYTCNHTYFSCIDSREKAYWLGWLWSDGNVYQYGNSYRVKIEIQKNDAYILQRFASDLESNGRIIIKNNSALFLVSSEEMFCDLNKYGVIPRKSYVNITPELPLTFAADFVRGVFDGDGSISKSKNPQITIIGTEALCHWLQGIVYEAIGAKGTCALKKNTTFRWILSGRGNLSAFAQWIYLPSLNGEKVVCLERKYQRFVDALLL